MNMPEEYKQKIIQLCEICPRISVIDNLGKSKSIGEEYIRGEAWIESILQEILVMDWEYKQRLAVKEIFRFCY